MPKSLAEHGIAVFKSGENVFEGVGVVDVKYPYVFCQLFRHGERNGGIGVIRTEQGEKNNRRVQCDFNYPSKTSLSEMEAIVA